MRNNNLRRTLVCIINQLKLHGTNKGYLYFMDKEHPMCHKTGRVYYHRHVAAVAAGRWLSSDEHVHHIDENILNNSPENLEILSASEHARIHMLERSNIKYENYKPFVPYETKCINCTNRIIISDSRSKGFCGTSCKNTYYYKNRIPFEPPENETEIFKNVIGFEDDFSISDNGNLFSKRTGKILKQTLSNGNPYHATKIKVGDEFKHIGFKISRVMAMAFIPNPENKPYVIHKDGNKEHNDLDNLMWATAKESTEYKEINNPDYHLKGDEQPNSKLTEDIVRYCRKVFVPKHKEFGYDALAKKVWRS